VAVKRIVEERPKPPTFVRRDYPADLEMIVLRTLEKRPEDRYQSATELHEDLQNFLARSKAHLRNNFQMADYLAKIFSEEADALISDSGRRRAEAFLVGGESAEADQADLDFDVQQSEGPGAVLARTLRTSALGVWADAGTPGDSGGNAGDDADGHGGSESESLSWGSAADLARAGASSNKSAPQPAGLQSGPAGKPDAGSSQDDDPGRVPRRWNGLIVAGFALATAVAAGLGWWLRGL
jgi:hypothetical protein